MSRYEWLLALLWATALTLPSRIAGAESLEQVLRREIIGGEQTMAEVRVYAETRVLPVPMFQSVVEWEQYAKRMRNQVLRQVILRGEANSWSNAGTRVEWLETIPGGPGYRIKKLRYEALPGLWIPALLYEPENLPTSSQREEGGTRKVPVILNVNGHDRNGKAADYKQIRCINQAKRGMLALNVEWMGMGQLRTDNFRHYRMNQIDLCGTSGIGVQYLYLRRAIDLLLSLEHADPERLAVTGLSGGGWQTIFISALDTRVKLADPVAGYSSYLTRAKHLSDLGDSEQTPTDLASVTDYAQMTALMAPRPLLLTYNAQDDCCFRADHALDPLLAAARPIYGLYGKPGYLRSHVNHDPGTHNYGLDNRQAFYRMLGDFFYRDAEDFDPEEIPYEGEIQTKEELHVELPADNADFHTLALNLIRKLPRHAELPGDKTAAMKWQRKARENLRQIVRAKQYQVEAKDVGRDRLQNAKVTYWQLKLDGTWTVPAVELEPKSTSGRTAILVADKGRSSVADQTEHLLNEGQRVLAVDPFYFGESKILKRDFLFALLVSALGDRPIGIQASQVAAAARWLHDQHAREPVTLVAVGPRSSLFALIAAGLEPDAIAELRLHGCLGSLKEVIQCNWSADKTPEMFCFGLLETFDIKQLVALAAPRPVHMVGPSEEAKSELEGLGRWYATLGADFDPLD